MTIALGKIVRTAYIYIVESDAVVALVTPKSDKHDLDALAIAEHLHGENVPNDAIEWQVDKIEKCNAWEEQTKADLFLLKVENIVDMDLERLNLESTRQTVTENLEDQIGRHMRNITLQAKTTIGRMMKLQMVYFTDGMVPPLPPYKRWNSWLNVVNVKNVFSDVVSIFDKQCEADKETYRIEAAKIYLIFSFKWTAKHYRLLNFELVELVREIQTKAKKAVYLASQAYCVGPEGKIRRKIDIPDILKSFYERFRKRIHDARDNFLADMKVVSSFLAIFFGNIWSNS